MKIHQVYTESELRNFTYLIELENNSALVIDPWDADEVNTLLQQKQLRLQAIINTHEHWDHIQGNKALVAEHGCEVWAHSNGQGKVPGLSRLLTAGELIDLDAGAQLRVLDTPGHTYAHLCFLVLEQGTAVAVFTGDTLFNAGVGHCRGSIPVMTIWRITCVLPLVWSRIISRLRLGCLGPWLQIPLWHPWLPA
jgi:hydroxyacylglutathione hydrolase